MAVLGAFVTPRAPWRLQRVKRRYNPTPHATAFAVAYAITPLTAPSPAAIRITAVGNSTRLFATAIARLAEACRVAWKTPLIQLAMSVNGTETAAIRKSGHASGLPSRWAMGTARAARPAAGRMASTAFARPARRSTAAR